MEDLLSVEASVGACQNFGRPAIADCYAVAGRLVCVETEDEDTARLFRRYFADWHVLPVPKTEAPSDARIVVRTDKSPDPPMQVESFEVAEGGMCLTDHQTYFFHHHGSVVSARGDEPATIDVWIAPDERGQDPRAVARLIFNAVMTATRRCALYDLHAAGVVAPKGAGFLIIGPSGSGKSTLAISLTSVGWSYLSDDTVFLSDREGNVEAHALRRVFALTEASRSAAATMVLQTAQTTVVPFDPLKKRFEPATVFPRRFAERCLPTTLLFSRITNEGKSKTNKLSQGETMARLLRMSPWACYDKAVAPSHLNVLAKLARQALGLELLAGEDLLDADYASQFVADLHACHVVK